MMQRHLHSGPTAGAVVFLSLRQASQWQQGGPQRLLTQQRITATLRWSGATGRIEVRTPDEHIAFVVDLGEPEVAV